MIFLTDDHGQLDSAVYGSKDAPTPHMQRLASEGMTFENAFVVSPSCAPSRAALLTGLMPGRNGADVNHARPRKDVKKWPAYFQDLGYEVVAFGKVSHYKHTGDYGFDYFAHDAFHDHEGIPAAVRFLETRDRASTRPLCMLVGSNWPHVPWPSDITGITTSSLQLPAGSVDTTATRRARAQYIAAVGKADEELGAIMAAARKFLPANTLFLMSGDHGAQWPFGKWNLYEAGLRVPLIVKWPGVVEPGTRSAAFVTWVDFLPTLLQAAGDKPPVQLDGKSFLHVLRDSGAAHRDRIFATHTADGHFNVYPMRSIRKARWKYIRNLYPEFAFTTHIDLPVELGQRSYWATWEKAAESDAGAAAIVQRYHARPAEELYDLSADPGEQRNIAEDLTYGAQLLTLRNELDAWMEQQGDYPVRPSKPRLLSDPTSYGPGAVSEK